jgi:hypothetical protein
MNLDYVIKVKLLACSRADDEHGRQYHEEDYVSLEWVTEKLVNGSSCCFMCNKIMKILAFEAYDVNQFTIDRLYSDMAHKKDNCVISCYSCNCAHKDNILLAI